MLPLELDGRCWGLVEVYRTGAQRFSDDDALGVEVIQTAARAIQDLQRRAAAA